MLQSISGMLCMISLESEVDNPKMQYLNPMFCNAMFVEMYYPSGQSVRNLTQSIRLPILTYTNLSNPISRFKWTIQCCLHAIYSLSLIHISEPTRLGMKSYAVFCLKKK